MRIATIKSFRSFSSSSVVLGIETSCDDTGVAVVCSRRGVVFHALSSQWNLHEQFGGVFPNEAKRAHSETLPLLLKEALSHLPSPLTAVAVTTGPGLAPCLAVGLTQAQSLCSTLNVPLVAVHHLHAHAMAAKMHAPQLSWPFGALIASGGHTSLVMCQSPDPNECSVVSSSLDDSVGEAFDKVWRMLQQSCHPSVWEQEKQMTSSSKSPHPGARLERLASLCPLPIPPLFPVPMRKKRSNSSKKPIPSRLDYSFSGLKASVARHLSSAPPQTLQDAACVAAAFQWSAFEHIAERTEAGLEGLTDGILVMSGGVAANEALRKRMRRLRSIKHLICPPPEMCTDNGIMIAWTGLLMLQYGIKPMDPANIKYDPRWKLGNKNESMA